MSASTAPRFGADLTNAAPAAACKSEAPCPLTVHKVTTSDCVTASFGSTPEARAARPVVLSVEAAIGTGKSSLLRLLQERAPASLGGKKIAVVQEPVDAWRAVGGEHNLLGAFYSEPQRFAFSFQTHCVLSRIRGVTEALATLPADVDIVVLERCWDSDRNTFAEMLREQGKISPMEWALYDEWYHFACRNAPRIDGHVYLQCQPDTCMQRLRKRDRSEEVGVTSEYQAALIEKHEEWLRNVELTKERHRRGICRLSVDRDFLSDTQYSETVVERILSFANELAEQRKAATSSSSGSTSESE